MRVFLGRESVSGVLWDYKLCLKSAGIESDVIIYDKHKFGYNYDFLLNPKGGKIIREILAILNSSKFILNYDIFHLFYGKSLVKFNLDVPFLKKLEKKIVMTFLGSDIRCSSQVLQRNIDKNDCSFCGYPCSYKEKIKMVKYWAKNANIIFSGVDNAQILDHYNIPYYYLTLPIDTDQWKPSDDNFNEMNEKPLLIHIPSSPHMKGTDLVLETIEGLRKADYKFDFKLLSGVPNDEVKDWLSKADIVIDRAIGRGWYGKLAVESMALSKVVIGYIDPLLRKRVEYGDELPMVSTYDKSLYDILSYYIEDRDITRKTGLRGREFVKKHHANTKIGQELLTIYKKELDLNL